MPGRVPFDYIQHLTARNGEYWGINKISCERCQYLVGVIEKVVHNLVVTPTIWAYGHILFHCSLLYCASQILHFFFFYKLNVCGNPVLSKSISTIFPMAFAHFVSLRHVLVILIIFQTFSLLWWCVVSGLWCYYCKKIMTHWRLRWW